MKLIKIPKKNMHYVQVVESYRDATGTSRHRVFKSYGILEEQEKIDPHFLDNLKKAFSKDKMSIDFDFKEKPSKKTINFGYIIIKNLLKELNIDSLNTILKDEYPEHINKVQSDPISTLIMILVDNLFNVQSSSNNIDTFRHYNLLGLEDKTINYDDIKLIFKHKDELLKIIDRNNRGNLDLLNIYCNIVKFYIRRDSNLNTAEIEHNVILSYYDDLYGIPLHYELLSQKDIKDNTDYKDAIDIARTKLKIQDISLVSTKDNVNSSLIEVKFSQDNFYLMGTIVNSDVHPYASIAFDITTYTPINDTNVAYQCMNIYRDVFVETKSGKIFKKTLREHLLMVCYEEGGYSLAEALECLRDVTFSSKRTDFSYISGKKEPIKGFCVFVLTSNDLEMSDLSMIDRYLGLNTIKSNFIINNNNPLTEEILDIPTIFFINYLSVLVKKLLRKKLNYKYSEQRIIMALRDAFVMPISDDVVSVCEIDPLIKILLDIYDIKLDSQYYRIETLRSILH